MKKFCFAFALATLAHCLYWGNRYLQTPPPQRSFRIFLGPCAGLLQKAEVPAPGISVVGEPR